MAKARPRLKRPRRGQSAAGATYGGKPTTPKKVALPEKAEGSTKLANACADVDRIFEEFATRTHVPGAAWGVVIDGELVHSGSTGYSDVGAKAPARPDTVFRIASMTKSFTAMSILKLRDEG